LDIRPIFKKYDSSVSSYLIIQMPPLLKKIPALALFNINHWKLSSGIIYPKKYFFLIGLA